MTGAPAVLAAPVLFATPTAQILSTPASGVTRHTVQRGETLASIASKYGVTVQELATANNISNPNLISVGQELFVPQR